MPRTTTGVEEGEEVGTAEEDATREVATAEDPAEEGLCEEGAVGEGPAEDNPTGEGLGRFSGRVGCGLDSLRVITGGKNGRLEASVGGLGTLRSLGLRSCGEGEEKGGGEVCFRAEGWNGWSIQREAFGTGGERIGAGGVRGAGRGGGGV